MGSFETSVARAVREAVDAGDYAAIRDLAELGEALAAFSQHVGYSGGDADSKPLANELGPGLRGDRARKSSSEMARRRKSRGLAKTGYPQFHRSGDRLVKVGWSRSKQATYQHRCPTSVAFALADALATGFGEGRPFKMDQVFPLRDETGREMPSYQIYLALALLRARGLVTSKGRQGFAVVEPDLRSAVEAVINDLDAEPR